MLKIMKWFCGAVFGAFALVLMSVPAMATTSWQQTTGLDSAYGVVTALSVDPVSPLIVYAGTPTNGLFKSSDGGDSWIRLRIGLPADYITSLTVDPRNPQNIYALTNPYNIYKSSDSGNSWKPINVGLPPSSSTLVYRSAIPGDVVTG